MLRQIFLVATFAASITAQITLTGTVSRTAGGGDYPTGSEVTYNTNDVPSTLPTTGSYVTLSATETDGPSQTVEVANITITTNGTVITTQSPTETILVGGYNPANGTNGTASSTTSSARPTNTQPCNGWPEFCERSYGNLTQIAAHNSPFSIQGNVASNQALDVTTQLNDGIRMLQFQVHQPNGTGGQLYMCHTTCDLLNAGLLLNYLITVRLWLEDNPYDVVTILMGNYEFLAPGNFTGPIIDSGLRNYVYTPPTSPMPLDSWPTLGEMILTNKRLVVMLDYEADQNEIPWLLDEFSNLWETPFSPTDRDFPCTAQRPPDKSEEVYNDRMYMANHNLNIDVALLGQSVLVPGFPLLNETNAVTGYGSAGRMSTNCTEMWNRPPNWILVDYYNIGSFNGSVFQVAADANGVQYDRDSCCGSVQGNMATLPLQHNSLLAIIALVCSTFMVLS